MWSQTLAHCLHKFSKLCAFLIGGRGHNAKRGPKIFMPVLPLKNPKKSLVLLKSGREDHHLFLMLSCYYTQHSTQETNISEIARQNWSPLLKSRHQKFQKMIFLYLGIKPLSLLSNSGPLYGPAIVLPLGQRVGGDFRKTLSYYASRGQTRPAHQNSCLLT